jgi:hypothetical protein
LNIRHPLYSFRAQILVSTAACFAAMKRYNVVALPHLPYAKNTITAFSRQNADELIKTFEIDVMVTQTQVIDLGSNE